MLRVGGRAEDVLGSTAEWKSCLNCARELPFFDQKKRLQRAGIFFNILLRSGDLESWQPLSFSVLNAAFRSVALAPFLRPPFSAQFVLSTQGERRGSMGEEEIFALRDETVALLRSEDLRDPNSDAHLHFSALVSQVFALLQQESLDASPSASAALLDLFAELLEKGYHQSELCGTVMSLWKAYIPLLKRSGAKFPPSTRAKLLTVLIGYCQDGVDTLRSSTDDQREAFEGGAKLLWMFLQRMAATLIYAPQVDGHGSQLSRRSLRLILIALGVVGSRKYTELEATILSGQQILMRLLEEGAIPRLSLEGILSDAPSPTDSAHQDGQSEDVYAVLGLKSFGMRRLQQDGCACSPEASLPWPAQVVIQCTAFLLSAPQLHYADELLLEDIGQLASCAVHYASSSGPGSNLLVDWLFCTSLGLCSWTPLVVVVARMVACAVAALLGPDSQRALCARWIHILAFASYHPRGLSRASALCDNGAETVRQLLLVVDRETCALILSRLLGKLLDSSHEHFLPPRQDVLEATLCSIPPALLMECYPQWWENVLKQLSAAMARNELSGAALWLCVVHSAVQELSPPARISRMVSAFVEDKNIATMLLKCSNALSQHLESLLRPPAPNTAAESSIAPAVAASRGIRFCVELLRCHSIPHPVLQVLSKCLAGCVAGLRVLASQARSSAKAAVAAAAWEVGVCECMACVLAIIALLGGKECDREIMQGVTAALQQSMADIAAGSSQSSQRLLLQLAALIGDSQWASVRPWIRPLLARSCSELRDSLARKPPTPFHLDRELDTTQWIPRYKICCQAVGSTGNRKSEQEFHEEPRYPPRNGH